MRAEESVIDFELPSELEKLRDRVESFIADKSFPMRTTNGRLHTALRKICVANSSH